MPGNRITIKKAGNRKISAGKNVTIITPSNLYECEIGDDSFVGPFTEIQKGVKIGQRCKIQSHGFICEGVTIGNDCFIGHGVMFINDTFSNGKPAGGDKLKWKTTTIENNVTIGSNATILPVTICSGVVIGAGAVVTKTIKQKGIYAGNPARLLKRLK
ncbi:MAG TPA: acyltransferase [Chitinophagaceae bacterium]|nr:acyltransferase [Chitinophagaceae bacterium]